MLTLVRKSTRATWQAKLDELKAENERLKTENREFDLRNLDLTWEVSKLTKETSELKMAIQAKEEVMSYGRRVNEMNMASAGRLVERYNTLKIKLRNERSKNELVGKWLKELAEKEKVMGKVEVSCDICMRPYSNRKPARTPRVLGCGHTMCLECMKTVAKSADMICCCFCRNTTHFPGLGIEGLAKNYAILQMIEEVPEDVEKKK